MGDDENNQQSAEEVLVTAIEGTADDRLPAFALRLALIGHTSLPREGEIDFLEEAEIAFATPKLRKTANKKEGESPSIKARKPKSAKRKPQPERKRELINGS